MNRFISRPGVAVTAAVAVVSLAACGGGNGGGGSSSSATDTLTVALNSDASPSGYDPLLYSQGQFQFFSALYDALFVTDADGKVQPSLVTDFSNSPDNLKLTLTLKDGVTFADGSELDSTLVKANLDARSDTDLLINGTLGAGGSQEITDVSAPDPKTVVITWKAPQAEGQNALADTNGVIVGKDAVADRESLATAPDGSGAYTLNEGKTTKGSTYTLDKNDKAWSADDWSYKHITFKVITDPQALANAVVSGQADVAVQLDQTTVDLVDSKQTTTKVGGVIVGFPVFDKLGSSNPAFKDPDVRLALSYGLDRESIVKDLHPASKATAQLFPSGSKGFDAALNETYAYDPAKAKKLLADAGASDLTIDLTFPGQPTPDLLAVQDQWKQIGVTLNIVPATSTDQIFAAAATQPLGFGPFGVGSNPAGFVAGVVVGGFANLQKAKDPAIEGSLGAALGATGAAQEGALKELNAALTNDGWYIPIYEDFTYAGYNADKVAEPKWAGTNNFLVLQSLTSAS
ncbi:MAG: Extracellular solute-binding protein family 5 [Blastococcus sp.]|nr:Extracellular solute-binding protein family 5 [Blastococcus sp.]